MYNLEIFTPKNGRPDGTVIAVGGEIATCTAMFPSIELHNRRFTESKGWVWVWCPGRQSVFKVHLKCKPLFCLNDS